MDPIKITDKLTLRQEALRLSILNSKGENRTTRFIIDEAKDFESYIIGSAELPERYNEMEKYLHEMRDMVFKQHNPWIPADSEMKPAKGVKVYVRTKSGSYYSGEYDDGWYVAHKPVGDEITAWIPIPPFTQSTKL